MTRLATLLLALVAALPLCAGAAPYPTRAIEIVVPYGAGGSTDLVARTLAQQLEARLHQPVVVINKPGGAGTIAVMSVMRALPDGYTLLLGFTTEFGGDEVSYFDDFLCQPGSKCFALITLRASGPDKNWVNPLAASRFLELPAMPAAKIKSAVWKSVGRGTNSTPGTSRISLPS